MCGERARINNWVRCSGCPKCIRCIACLFFLTLAPHKSASQMQSAPNPPVKGSGKSVASSVSKTIQGQERGSGTTPARRNCLTWEQEKQAWKIIPNRARHALPYLVSFSALATGHGTSAALFLRNFLEFFFRSVHLNLRTHYYPGKF